MATAPEAHELAVDRMGPGRRGRCPGWPAPRRRTRRARGWGTRRAGRARGTARAALRERDAAQRRAEIDADPLARRRAPPTPGTSPASAIAIRPVASPNWLNRSSARAASASMWSSGSKSSTCAATCDRNGRGVEAVDALHRRGVRAAGRRGTRGSPIPMADSTPMPVTQTRAPVGLPCQVFAAGAVVAASASASALNVASVRPAMGRVKAASTNAANPGTPGRKSCSISTRVPAARGLDRPGHVHPLRRAGHVDEPQAARRRLVPGPAAPRDRDPEPEQRDERPPRDEVADEGAVGVASDDRDRE